MYPSLACPFCSSVSSNAILHSTHLRRHCARHCGLCGLRLASLGALRRHKLSRRCRGLARRSISSPVDIEFPPPPPKKEAKPGLKCPKCPYVTTKPCDLRNHLMRAGGCSFQASRARVADLGGRTRCEKCPYEAPEPYALLLHMRRPQACARWTSVKALKDLGDATSCPNCSYGGPDSASLLSHLRRPLSCPRNQIIEAALALPGSTCPYCKAELTDRRQLERHLSSSSSHSCVPKALGRQSGSGLFCDACGSVHFGPEKMGRHFKHCGSRHHQPVALNNAASGGAYTGIGVCPDCGIGFYNLQPHLAARPRGCIWARAGLYQRALTGESLDCPLCQTSFRKGASLLRHLHMSRRCRAAAALDLQTPGQPCPGCAKVVGNMTHHLRWHPRCVQASLFACDACGASLGSRDLLRRHVLAKLGCGLLGFQGLRPLRTCDDCGARGVSLANHAERCRGSEQSGTRLTGNGNGVCPQCGFVGKNLHRHMASVPQSCHRAKIAAAFADLGLSRNKEDGVYHCPSCDWKHQFPSTVLAHIGQISGSCRRRQAAIGTAAQYRTSCPICSAKLATSALEQHLLCKKGMKCVKQIVASSDGDSHPCATCRAVFPTQHLLTMHNRSGNGCYFFNCQRNIKDVTIDK